MEIISKRIIQFIVSLALFMETLDTTVLNTAIPAMSLSLNVNPINLKIALISYLISLAIFIPISGWIADKFGIKKVFIAALIIFTLSSLWCGFADNLTFLVIARILQGLGGSLTLPLGRLIIARTFSRQELVNAMGQVIMIGAFGMMLGPALGGFITHQFSWRWVFWINIPVGLFAALLAAKFLPVSLPEKVPPLDKLGFFYFGTGLAALTFGLSAMSESTIPIPYSLSILLTAMLLLSAYVLHSKNISHPIVKDELFASRTFLISVLGNLFSRLGFGGIPFLLPLLLQIDFGYSSQTAGLLLAPTAIGVLFNKLLTVRVIQLLGYKRLLIINTILMGMAIWLLMLINAYTSFFIISFYTFLFGFLMAMQFGSMNSLAFADIDTANLNSATSITSTIQQLGQSFGVAFAALFIRYFSPTLQLTTSIFHYTFFAMGFATIFSAVIFLFLTKEDGYQLMQT